MELTEEQRKAIEWASEHAANYARPIEGETTMMRHSRVLREILAGHNAGAQEPVAVLHDDGHWTWKGTPPYESNFAGWRMDVYSAPRSFTTAIPQDFCQFGKTRAYAFKASDAGEHDPWYVVLPNQAALKLGYHACDAVDKAHAEFIASAINQALYTHPQPMPMTDAARDVKLLVELLEDARDYVQAFTKDEADGHIASSLVQQIDAEIERLDRAKGE